MSGRFSIETVFKAVDRITGPVKRMQTTTGKFTRSLESGFRRTDRVMSGVARGIKRTAQVTVAGLALITAALVNAGTAGAGFEQAITNVGAVGLQTRAEIAPLEAMALELGRSTKFTATQAANAMEILARAGFDTNQILAATPATLAAAAASGLDIAEVANHVSNVLKGMGLEMTESGRVADVLALASARTNSSIGSLGESMKNVASTASQLNVPLEETVAAIALLQDVGLDASVAGSAFNVMLTKMAKPTPVITAMMKRFGISFKDAKGDMLPLAGVLEQLNKASGKFGGNFDKVAFLAELVGLRGQKAASQLGKLFESGKLTKLTEELQKAEGVAQKMADIRMNTLEGDLTLLGSAVDAVKVKMFGMQSGPLRDIVQSMTTWVGANEELIASGIAEWIGRIIDNRDKIATWAKNIGIGVAAFIALSIVLKTLILALSVVNLLMLANPITLWVIGILAAAAALTVVVVKIDEITAAMDEWGPVIRFATAPLRGMLAVVKAIKDGIYDSADGFKDLVAMTPPGMLAKGFSNMFGDGTLLQTSSERGEQPAPAPQVVPPETRIAQGLAKAERTISEVLVSATPGTSAAPADGKRGAGVTVQDTGGF
jgi:TP901 family phage tail tape measure protein